MASSWIYVAEVCVWGTGWGGCAVLLYQGAWASLLVSAKALTVRSDYALCISSVFCTSAVSFLPGPLKRCAGVSWLLSICVLMGEGRGSALELGEEESKLAWEVLSSSTWVKLWFAPKLRDTVCLHWSREERGNFLIWLTSATAQGLGSAQTWLQGHQVAPDAKAKLPLLLFKPKFPAV